MGRRHSGGFPPGVSATRRRTPRSLFPTSGVLALVLVVVIGWYAMEVSSDCRGNTAQARLEVAAAPDIAATVTRAIRRYNETDGAAEDKCVRATVLSTDPSAMTVLLSGQGQSNGAERRPDVWIPDSSLWTALVSTSPQQGRPFRVTRTSLARTPLVLGLPQGLVDRLKSDGITAEPSWNMLMRSSAEPAGGPAAVPRELVRLQVPDPSRSAAGMGALVVARQLPAGQSRQEEVFTNLVRTARENLVPSVSAEFDALGDAARSRHPVLLVPEQSVYAYNGARPAERVVALYPREGTLSNDYPFTVTTDDPARVRAAGLLEQALRSEAARAEFREAGFRGPDGKVTSGFGRFAGVSPQTPKELPIPRPQDVQQIMQSWARLTASVRLLVLFDVSTSMDREVAAGMTRLQATARVGQSGLPLLADDSELGMWSFPAGPLGPRVIVPLGSLGQRIGSSTRRQLILSELGRLNTAPEGKTGLYDSILTAFRRLNDAYRPEMVNAVLVFTDGRNGDGHPSLEETVKTLRREYDPARPVQIVIQGYGPDVEVDELRRLAKVTNGLVQVAKSPEETRRLLLEAWSKG